MKRQASATAEATIRKPREGWKVVPNLRDYDRDRATFDWDDALRRELDGLPGSRGLNMAHEAVDRHAAADRADHLAIRWLGKTGEVVDLTYGDLAARSSRFANVLRRLGVEAGDPVFTLTGRIPELYVTALGTLKHRSVFAPLFSAFGPEPIRARLGPGEGRVLVTTHRLYERKIAPIRDALPALEQVLIVDPSDDGPPPDTLDFGALMDAADAELEIPPTDPEDRALLHFTSGTTGRPKGAIHVHQAVIAHHVTGKLALDFHPDDVFWCTADPGWVTGTSYGILAPLTNGITSVVDEAEMDPERWYGILQDQGVTVWYTAPTALRVLMRVGPELPSSYDLGRLRFIASVGEPLNPEVVLWGRDHLRLPIHDNWWQTETGGIMIANYAAMDIRPGSMGRPLPGVEAAIVKHRTEDEAERTGDGVVPIEEPGVEGELALRADWPSVFRGYLGEEERYRRCFADGWYLTGDLARCDEDGYYWFVGRADDVIKSAGHLIGPFEVESVLMEHPAVTESAVIGVPDPVAGEAVKAFVSIAKEREPTEELRRDILAHARRRLGPAVAPRQIEFSDEIPKTRSGKIMRRLLKARELGLPEGDLSTLEPGS